MKLKTIIILLVGLVACGKKTEITPESAKTIPSTLAPNSLTFTAMGKTYSSENAEVFGCGKLAGTEMLYLSMLRTGSAGIGIQAAGIPLTTLDSGAEVRVTVTGSDLFQTQFYLDGTFNNMIIASPWPQEKRASCEFIIKKSSGEIQGQINCVDLYTSASELTDLKASFRCTVK